MCALPICTHVEGIVMSDEYGQRDLKTGHWVGCRVIRTRSGTLYFIDLDLMMLWRVPATKHVDSDGAGALFSVALRRDNQRLKVLRIYLLAVGFPAIFDVEPLGDSHRVAFTRRATTEVVSIEPIEPWPLDSEAGEFES